MVKFPLIVIIGPTGSGKSELAIRLAKEFNGEIVNADSRQVYKGMDIGTGKPPKQQRHHLFDVVKPDEEFTLAHYKKLAVQAIQEIQSREKIPFLVGGTGLYIKAIVDNLEIPEVAANKKLRIEFESALSAGRSPSAKSLVLKKYYQKLLKLDPDAANLVPETNPRRIIRALEVCIATGKPFSKQREKGKPLFDVLQLGVKLPRKELYKRIDTRVDLMIKQGLISETKKLMKKYPSTLPSMSGIGYREIGQYLNGKLSLDKAKELMKYRTHAYARRQMTWFRKDKRIIWIASPSQAEKLVRRRLGRRRRP